METAEIEYVPANLQSHVFVRTLCEQKVVYQTLRMAKSVFVWIGFSSDPTFSDISMAMKTPYSPSPLVTQVMGMQADTASCSLAARLSKRLDKPVYVSFNLPSDSLTLNAVEAQISEEIKNFPEKF